MGHWAGSGVNKPWSMKRENLSPRYTTCWSEIPIVKASFQNYLDLIEAQF